MCGSRRYVVGSSPTDLMLPLFFRERQKGNDVFASVRAGDVNGYDSLPLSTTVVRGEGRELLYNQHLLL